MNWHLQELKKDIPGQLDQTLQADIQNIPDRISFKISEIAKLLNVKPHVLRYWEMEFELLKPRKMPNGQRLYFKKDLQIALLIKKLLYRDGFSVRGAKKVLRSLKKENTVRHKQMVSQVRVLKVLDSIQKTVSSLRELIK